MRELEKVSGIILRTHASGDSDLVLRILTREEGKIACLARQNRSTKRSAASTLDLFDTGFFELQKGRGPLRLVKGFVSEQTMHHLRESLDVLTLASVACEITDVLSMEDSGTGVGLGFEALLECLSAMNSRLTLRENCAVLFQAVAALLGEAGFLDTTTIGRGSRDALLGLIIEAERVSERQLRSKQSLLEIIRRL